jgi:phage/plasmid-like protein (TIGR03299 family)
MAHELTITNGVAEMAYSGDLPWHGLGQRVDPDASVDEWINQAGMEWDVKRSRVRYATDAEGTTKVWDDNLVLFRSDNGNPLGIVSPQFKVVQPRDVLEFFRDLTEAAGFKLITAGTLKGGRKFWAQADTGEQGAVIGNDMVKQRLLLATAVDGSMQTLAKNVSERVVCANTLAFALSESGAPEVRVTHRSEFNADYVKKQLGLAIPNFHKFLANMRELSRVELVPGQAEALTVRLLSGVDDVESEGFEKAKDHYGYKKIMQLFDGSQMGYSMLGVQGTAYGWLNAVTEFTSHHARSRSADNRLDSLWFGKLDELSQHAANDALALIAA